MGEIYKYRIKRVVYEYISPFLPDFDLPLQEILSICSYLAYVFRNAERPNPVHRNYELLLLRELIRKRGTGG
jgi:hypothetical protein